MSAPAAARAAAAPARHGARTAARVLAAAVVLAQITYPLLTGRALVATTVGVVLLFAAASLVSAAGTHGPRAAATLLVVAGGTGLLAEAVGVATGWPFGRYAYAGTLGPQVLGVPVIIPLAWTMMAWPTLLAGRALARAGAARWAAASGPARWLPVPIAAWALTSWDLFLDPQMVAAGHWTWADPTPALPGVPGIPLTNYAGWLLVALVVHAGLHALVPDPSPGTPAADGWGPPAVLLVWTWAGSTAANLLWFERPAVGLWGAAAMGAVVGPYLVAQLRRGAPRTRR